VFAFRRAPAAKLGCAGEKLTSTPFGDGWKRWASFFCGCRSLCLLSLPASGWSGFWSSESIQVSFGSWVSHVRLRGVLWVIGWISCGWHRRRRSVFEHSFRGARRFAGGA